MADKPYKKYYEEENTQCYNDSLQEQINRNKEDILELQECCEEVGGDGGIIDGIQDEIQNLKEADINLQNQITSNDNDIATIFDILENEAEGTIQLNNVNQPIPADGTTRGGYTSVVNENTNVLEFDNTAKELKVYKTGVVDRLLFGTITRSTQTAPHSYTITFKTFKYVDGVSDELIDETDLVVDFGPSDTTDPISSLRTFNVVENEVYYFTTEYDDSVATLSTTSNGKMELRGGAGEGIVKTTNVILDDPSVESISGTAASQKLNNIEFVNEFPRKVNKKTYYFDGTDTFGIVNLPSLTSIIFETFVYKGRDCSDGSCTPVNGDTYTKFAQYRTGLADIPVYTHNGTDWVLDPPPIPTSSGVLTNKAYVDGLVGVDGGFIVGEIKQFDVDQGASFTIGKATFNKVITLTNAHPTIIPGGTQGTYNDGTIKSHTHDIKWGTQTNNIPTYQNGNTTGDSKYASGFGTAQTNIALTVQNTGVAQNRPAGCEYGVSTEIHVYRCVSIG